MTAHQGDTAVHRGSRVATTCVCSIVLGGVFGVVAAVGMGMGLMAHIALIYGAIAGFLCSPVLIFGLRYGPVLSGLAWIAVPTTVAGYVGGTLTPPNGGPFLSMVVAISVYVLASLMRGIVGLKYHRPLPVGSCPYCAYDLKGLAQESVCPECGASRPKQEQT
jgi:hypothetical protein